MRATPSGLTAKCARDDYAPPTPAIAQGLVFAEPSTRTMQSFNMAMQRLGGTTFVVDADKSSRKKGETMHDTVK